MNDELNPYREPAPIDPFMAMLIPALQASGNPAGAVLTNPYEEGPPTGSTSLLGRLAMLAQFFGNALPGRGGIGDPIKWLSLYRGEHTPSKPGPRLPMWKSPAMNETSGRWYTSDRARAEVYAKDAQQPSRLLEVQIPENLAGSYRLYAQDLAPEVRATIGSDASTEYLLPRFLIDMARRAP